MKKQTIAITLGLCLTVSGFGQPSKLPSRKAGARPVAAKSQPKASPLSTKKAATQPLMILLALDDDRDGKLSKKEIAGAVAALKELDLDKDGELTLKEYGPLPEGSKSNRGDGTSAKGGELSSFLKGGVKPSTKPKPLAGRTSGTGKASANATRRAAKPRPGARSRRSIAKKSQGAQPAKATSASATSSKSRVKPKRTVRTSPAQKRTKPASRRRSGGAATAAKVVAPMDAQITALVDDARSITTKVQQAMGSIKDSGKRQAAQRWVRTESKAFLISLNAELKGQDAAKKAALVEEAKQKLSQIRQLIE